MERKRVKKVNPFIISSATAMRSEPEPFGDISKLPYILVPHLHVNCSTRLALQRCHDLIKGSVGVFVFFFSPPHVAISSSYYGLALLLREGCCCIQGVGAQSYRDT